MEDIRVEVDLIGGGFDIVHIHIRGYIDTTTSAELEHALSEVLKVGGYKLIMDCSKVDYISSAGWGIFISEIKGIREGGGDLVMCGMIPDVYDVFELLEYHYILRAYDTVEEAIEYFENPHFLKLNIKKYFSLTHHQNQDGNTIIVEFPQIRVRIAKITTMQFLSSIDSCLKEKKNCVININNYIPISELMSPRFLEKVSHFYDSDLKITFVCERSRNHLIPSFPSIELALEALNHVDFKIKYKKLRFNVILIKIEATTFSSKMAHFLFYSFHFIEKLGHFLIIDLSHAYFISASGFKSFQKYVAYSQFKSFVCVNYKYRNSEIPKRYFTDEYIELFPDFYQGKITTVVKSTDEAFILFDGIITLQKLINSLPELLNSILTSNSILLIGERSFKISKSACALVESITKIWTQYFHRTVIFNQEAFRAARLNLTVKKNYCDLQEKLAKSDGMPKKSFVFISYSAEDKEFALKLSYDLRKKGVVVWIDLDKIFVGDNFVSEISMRISDCKKFCVIVSPNSLASKWVHKEISLALHREVQSNKNLILPILFKGDKLPPQLVDKSYADFRLEYDRGLKHLLKAIG